MWELLLDVFAWNAAVNVGRVNLQVFIEQMICGDTLYIMNFVTKYHRLLYLSLLKLVAKPTDMPILRFIAMIIVVIHQFL